MKKIRQIFQRKIIKDALALYSGRTLILIVGVSSTLIYGIIFSKTQIALISLYEMVVELFISFGFTWSTTGIVRFGREKFLIDRDLSYASSTRLHLIIPLLIFSAIIILIFKDSITGFIGTDSQIIIFFIILNISLMVFHEHINSLFNAAEKHVANVIFQFSHSIGKLFLLSLFIFNIIILDAQVYIYLSVLLLTILVFVRIPYLEKSFLFPIVQVRKDDFISYFKFVSPQIYGFAGMYLVNWMDLYFLRQFTSYEDLGAYQFLYSIFLKITSFAFLINILFFPKIMGWKNSNEEALKKYLNKMPIAIFAVTIIGIISFLILYQPLFSLFFSEKYQSAYPAFNIILTTVPFFFVSFLFIPVLNSYDRVSYIQITNIVSALGNLCIDYFLIRKYGLIAAALGTYLAYILQFLLLIYGIKRIFRTRAFVLNLFSFVLSVIVIVYFFYKVKLF